MKEEEIIKFSIISLRSLRLRVSARTLFRVIAGILVLFFAGCFSVADGAGRVLDGSAFEEKKIAFYRSSIKDGDRVDMEVVEVQNKAGERSVLLSLGDFPMMKLRGTMPNENGEFFLLSLEFLGGSVQGWNEYTMDLLGEGSLVLGDNSVLELNEEIEKVEISYARIQRHDTRIIGNEALTGLRNRRERVSAVVQWMRSLDASENGQSIENFEMYWKPVLFPEVVSKKYSPLDWTREGDIFIKSEDINWNTSYTKRVFPEELHQVRNSGTLLRDWEEALSWLYMEYQWDSIVQCFSQETVLRKIK
jgi:hypothetical protein